MHCLSNSERSFPFHQTGVLPYRQREGRVEVLLITSRTRGRWIIPKGNLEPDRTIRDVARAEAYEEAGIRGDLALAALGSYWHGDPPRHRVQVFLMRVRQVLKTWPEQAERKRAWLPLGEARVRIDEDGVRRLFGAIDDHLGR